MNSFFPRNLLNWHFKSSFVRKRYKLSLANSEFQERFSTLQIIVMSLSSQENREIISIFAKTAVVNLWWTKTIRDFWTNMFDFQTNQYIFDFWTNQCVTFKQINMFDFRTNEYFQFSYQYVWLSNKSICSTFEQINMCDFRGHQYNDTCSNVCCQGQTNSCYLMAFCLFRVSALFIILLLINEQ